MPYSHLPPVEEFTVDSPDVADGVSLGPAQLHTFLGGGNTAPTLSWSGFPEGTAGFAVTCFDPDAPTPCGFWHWLVVDIPANATTLSPVSLPEKAFCLRNDFGNHGFDGCAARPGSGHHRYVFAVHALDTETLGIGPETSAAMASAHLTAHTIGRALLTPVYTA
ncbi:YbhB/YbcL family Raf kinase inhibitor-like protein [Actinocrispum sp. NPDC049592]|uniref:YbhB/YbcL family Raf kinase inhibitor-like protein n=1 Tax=Actinocrispum sp. NPDC049592 TaxID=3154835 RepID=UPI003438F58D